jgi:hypothetical protein
MLFTKRFSRRTVIGKINIFLRISKEAKKKIFSDLS